MEYNGIIKAPRGKNGGKNMRHTFDSIAGYELEKQELLLRTHGGAVPVEEGNHELSLEKRKNKPILMRINK